MFARVGRGPVLQRALGVVMVLTAVAMGTQLDVRFQTALADNLPQFVVNPTGAIERSAAAETRLADLRGEAKFDRATAKGRGAARHHPGARRATWTSARRPASRAAASG